MRVMALTTSFALCLSCALAAAPAPGDSTARTSRWQADLDYFARELPAKQKDFYQLLPRERFEQSVGELKSALPRLSDAEIVLELTRLVASLGIGHTRISIGSGLGAQAFHRYPIQLQWFADGLRVVAAEAEHREAVGCRVTGIGSLTPEQAEARVAVYVATENTNHLRVGSSRCMALVELMRHEKIADADGRLELTCMRADGRELRLPLMPMPSGAGRRGLVGASEVFHIPQKFCHKKPKAYYWYEYLPGARTLYIQYSKCHDAPGEPFAEFTRKLFAEADKRPVQRVIVDLRFNGGGNSGIIRPLVDALKARPALSQRGHLYALIGPHTFSSGVFAANSFRAGLHAIMVGEPVGNKPNHYGAVKSFLLPSSQLKVDYSTRHFHMVRNGDPASLYPDVSVPDTFEDHIAGRDRVLETAFRLPLH